jgi:hypothetical protein
MFCEDFVQHSFCQSTFEFCEKECWSEKADRFKSESLNNIPVSNAYGLQVDKSAYDINDVPTFEMFDTLCNKPASSNQWTASSYFLALLPERMTLYRNFLFSFASCD